MTDIVPLKEKQKKQNKGNGYNAVFYRWLGYRVIEGDTEQELALYEAVQEIIRTERYEAVEGLKKDIENLTLKDDDEEKLLCLDEIEIIERLIDARFGTHEKKT